MKSRILALLLALCLLPLTASADAPTLPDLGVFAGELLQSGDTEDFDFCKRVTLYGTRENVLLVAEAYVELLLEKYDITKHAHFTNFYDGGQSRRHYALGYAGDAQIGTVGYDDENEGWQITDAAIVLTCSQYQQDNFVQLTYRAEFNYQDTGDRLEVATQRTLPAAPTPSTSDTQIVIQKRDTASVATCGLCSGKGTYKASCGACHGAGVNKQTCSTCNGRSTLICSTCGGDKYTKCGACDGHGTRDCSSCGGTGHHSSSHHSDSHHSSDTCSTCGGDGQRSCSACAKTGKLNCRTCRAAGRQDCQDCLFGTISTLCTLCDGTGFCNTSCGLCDGTGIIK